MSSDSSHPCRQSLLPGLLSDFLCSDLPPAVLSVAWCRPLPGTEPLRFRTQEGVVELPRGAPENCPSTSHWSFPIVRLAPPFSPELLLFTLFGLSNGIPFVCVCTLPFPLLAPEKRAELVPRKLQRLWNGRTGPEAWT